MHPEVKEKIKPSTREHVRIETKVKNLSDPVNDLICSHCLVYVNCSESCEHIKEVYARIGEEFYNDDTLYKSGKLKTQDHNRIRIRMESIIKEYLKEKEICYGIQGDT